MFIDSHAHLNFKDFANDYEAVIESAQKAGVGAIINVGASLESSAGALKLAARFKNKLYATVGIHPNEAKNEKFDEELFLKMAKNNEVVAIGEMGLDYFGGNIDKAGQIDLLKKQINIANRLGKPIILHCREAYEDLVSTLMAISPLPRGVLHCYVGDWSYAQIFLDMGFLISFTGIITFSKSENLRQVVEKIPLNKILIETDSPWLAPEPHRGKRNEPAYVVEVARKISEIKKVTTDEVEATTTKNAQELFHLFVS